MEQKIRENEKIQKINKSKWSGKHQKKTSRNRQYSKTQQKIIEKAEKMPLKKSDLVKLLKNCPNFVGIFAEDELKQCHIVKFPAFIIVNIDSSNQPGSHWICLRIGRIDVEIFDSLGFCPNLWVNFPTNLFQFLSYYSLSHNILISPVLQPPNTVYCGLFAVYFIQFRQTHTFSTCISRFSRRLEQNFHILFELLLHFKL